MRAAGFVIVGKLATAEVGALPVTEPLTHGPTLTPWCLGTEPSSGAGPMGPRSAGGSSGGSGAAVAARLIPIAPGSDGAGSIRIPGAFNGLVGIKPSRGLVANAYGLPDRNILYTDGPLARSVVDAAHLLDALTGATVGSRSWAPAPSASFAAATKLPPRPLRIRVATEHALAATEPDIRDATLRIAAVLAGHGHHVEPGTWLATAIDEFLPIWQHAVAQSRYIIRRSGMSPVTAWLHARGRRITSAAAEARKAALAQQVDAWFGDVDVWLSPTVCMDAPPVGLAAGSDGEAAFLRAAPLGGFTALFNLSGGPAITIPVGLSRTGLPIGVQIAGRLYDDLTLIQLAAQLEASVGAMPATPCATPTAACSRPGTWPPM